MSPALEVLATGPLCLVEDEGRPGLAALGVGRSGAADRARAPARGPARRSPARPGRPRGAPRRPRRPGEGPRHRRPHRGARARHASTAGRSRTRRSSRSRTVPCSPSGCRPPACARTSPCGAGSTWRRCWGHGRPTRCRGSARPRCASGTCCPSVTPAWRSRASTTPRGRPGPRARPTSSRCSPGPGPAWVGGWGTDLGGLLSASWRVSGHSDRVGLRLTGSTVSRAAAHDGAELPERGRRARGRPGARRRGAGGLPRRPPGDRRLPRRGGAHGIRRRPGRAAAARRRRPPRPRPADPRGRGGPQAPDRRPRDARAARLRPADPRRSR